MSIDYSSSSVDGRSEVTNNQPSWLGEGFDYWPGYIERQYVSCSEDMEGGTTRYVPVTCAGARTMPSSTSMVRAVSSFSMRRRAGTAVMRTLRESRN